VDEARDELVAQRRLAAAAAEWDAGGREEDFLFGTALAARYVAGPVPAAGSLESAFLEASRDRNEAAERKKHRTRRLIAAGFGLAALISLVLAFTANQRRNDADNARVEAEARALASAALLQSETNTELGLLLAVEAYRADPTPGGLGPLITALSRVSGRSELFADSAVPIGEVAMGLVLVGDVGSVSSRISCVQELGPGRFLAANSSSGDATAVLSDAVTRRAESFDSPTPCRLSLNESSGLAIGSSVGGVAQIFDLSTGETIVPVDRSVTRAEWLPSGRILGFTAGTDRGGNDLGDIAERVELAWIDPVSGEATPSERAAVTVSAGPAGRLILLTDRDEPVYSGAAFGGPVGAGSTSIISKPVQKYLVSADDLSVVHDLGEMAASNSRASWSDDGSMVGDISSLGRLRIWDTATGARLVDARVSGTSPYDAAWIDFAPSGGMVVAVRESGEITRHELTPTATEIGQVFAGRELAATSFIDEDRLAVMRDTGAIEIFDFSLLPFADSVVDCCGPGLAPVFSDDGSSGAVRGADGSLQIVRLPGGLETSPDLAIDAAGLWVGDDGAAVVITRTFELIDPHDPARRGRPFGDVVAPEVPSRIGAADDAGVANAWAVALGPQDQATGIVLGRVDMASLSAVEGPHTLALPPNTRFVQPLGDRLLVQDSMGTIRQFAFDAEPMSPRITLSFLATSVSGLPGASVALIAGDNDVALVDLGSGEVLATAAIEAPAPIGLLPDGFAVLGRQGDGLDLWSTDPLLRLGRIANADPGGLIQLTSIDAAGNLWYSSGERYQRIPIDPEAWVRQACDLGGTRLTEIQWRQFVSASRDYNPAC
jgi:WD40 repeat protein